MAKNNDNQIMALKRQIADKKNALKAIKNFSPKTNCSINLNGVQLNLNVLSPEALLLLRAQLNSLRMSCVDMEVPVDDLKISGYTLTDWLLDVSAKYSVVSKNAEEARLKVLEDRLTDLLSADKKTALLLDDLKSQL